MKIPKLVLVNCDDWQALYVDGKCVYQHHEVDLVYWLEKLGIIKIEEVWAENDPYIKEHANFSDDIQGVIPDDDKDLPLLRPVRD